MSHQIPFILTKIIATVGPSCSSVPQLSRLIEEGVRVFRINFSHGQISDFERSLKLIREASDQTGIAVGALGDLSGPKIRVGKVVPGGVELEIGQTVRFQTKPIVTGEQPSDDDSVTFSTTYPAFIGDVQPGQRLLVDDGAVRMAVVKKEDDGDEQQLVCNVTIGGRVTSSKGINLPDTEVSAPSLTDHDLRCVEWAIEHGLDFLALSFVRQADDIHQLKQRLIRTGDDNPNAAIPIIAKIEKPQALDDLEAIIRAADGLMVARGDLGVEMDLAKVPGIQKRILRLARDYGKPVIVATQMLQSMIEAATPTRAEVGDVANAIYEGASAVMLSGETAVGQYPIQAVQMMAQIAKVTQEDVAKLTARDRPPRKLQESHYRTAALAHGVNVVVRDLGAKLMGVWSQRGGGARYLSQNRPNIPIIAASSDPAVLRRMNLYYGVIPVQMDCPASIEDFTLKIDRLILDRGWGKPGDEVVLLAGEPIGMPGLTNTLLIRYLGGVCRVA